MKRRWIAGVVVLGVAIALFIVAQSILQGFSILRDLQTYRELSATHEAILKVYRLPFPQNLASERFPREVDLLCFGLKEAELLGPVRVERVQVTALEVYDLNKVSNSMSVDEGFLVWIAGTPSPYEFGKRGMLGFPVRWTTTLYTNQRTLSLGGASEPEERAILAANNLNGEELRTPQIVAREGSYLLRWEPTEEVAVKIHWASFSPLPIAQRHLFSESGQWIASYALYESAEVAKRADLNFWDESGSEVRGRSVARVSISAYAFPSRKEAP